MERESLKILSDEEIYIDNKMMMASSMEGDTTSSYILEKERIILSVV